MMNLNDVKGAIEINGETYDPKSIIKALLEQGLKIHPLNGSLLIGRTFIDSSPNLKYGSKVCPISEHCKIYDKLYSQKASDINFSETNKNQNTFSDDSSSESLRTPSDRFYTDPVQIDIEDFDITNLFLDSNTIKKPSDEIEEIDILDSDFRRDLDFEPTEMIGLSPVTRYGKTSNIKESMIPSEYRGRCPYCNSIVNIRWKYCGNCGTSMI